MFRTATITTAALVALSAAAFADQPGKDWMSKQDVMKKMQSQGYSSIIMEADDGHWEGEAVKDGRIVEFDADPHTGAVTKSKLKRED